MLDKQKEEIYDRNYYLNKRKDARLKTRFLAHKRRYFILAIVLSFLLISMFYFLSNQSRIYQIVVKGNIYSSKDEIIAKSGLTLDSRYFLSFPFLVEKNIEKDPLIEDATVQWLPHRVVSIEVREKKIVGYVNEERKAYFLLEDDTRIEVGEENMHMIESLPLIEGYTKEQISAILRGFKTIDHRVIDQISEIHRYPFSYDENMLEVVMRDGNYVFVSSFGLEMLNDYYTIVSGIQSSDNVCLYLDEATNSGYTSSCPWSDEVKEKEEIDMDGNEEEEIEEEE